jgi:hypothetical protein
MPKSVPLESGQYLSGTDMLAPKKASELRQRVALSGAAADPLEMFEGHAV